MFVTCKFKRIGLTPIAAGLALLALSEAVLVAQTQRSSAEPLGARGAAAGAAGKVAATKAHDPGVRAGSIGAGQPIATLSSEQLQVFHEGETQFKQAFSVSGNAPNAPGHGLGPTFNSDSCSSCHAQPDVGGTSPNQNQFPSIGPNPQAAIAHKLGATNNLPSFVKADGPVFAVRFPSLINADGELTSTPDGDVHALFSIAGRSDAPNCNMSQPEFGQLEQFNNAIFRIPTPIFGSGLIENIPNAAILANMNAEAELKKRLGISGRTNGGGTGPATQTSGPAGAIGRFGWKSQHNSLETFAGEAFDVEMGVTSDQFPTKRGAVPMGCYFGPDGPTSGVGQPPDLAAGLTAISEFMRFLAPPARSGTGIPGNPSRESLQNGEKILSEVHCDACHTPALQTGDSSDSPAFSRQVAGLFSDLLLHHMGTGLADRVTQGAASSDEFRTAPLWGAGQRIFFMHDGRATAANGGLLTAIEAHASPGSEANNVISLFNGLNDKQKQDLLNFLRSL